MVLLQSEIQRKLLSGLLVRISLYKLKYMHHTCSVTNVQLISMYNVQYSSRFEMLIIFDILAFPEHIFEMKTILYLIQEFTHWSW